MNKKFQIILQYDQLALKWEVFVEGAASELEAKQGFNAVLLTLQETFVTLEHKVKIHEDGKMELIPAVI